MEILLLNLLIMVPICAWLISKRVRSSHKWLVIGISFGVVISPLSMGLYATFYVSPLGLVTGLLGLVSSMFHEAAGYKISVYFGLVPSSTVISGMQQHLYIEGINAVVWGVVYGLLGWCIDLLLFRHRTGLKGNN